MDPVYRIITNVGRELAREEEIKRFKPSTYFVLEGSRGALTLTDTQKKRFKEGSDAKRLLESLASEKCLIKEYRITKDKEFPPATYTI